MTYTIRWLGVGAAGRVELGNTTASITGESLDGHLLIDCGRNIPERLHRYGIDWPSISTVAITHTHSDHIGGLELFAQMSYYRDGRKENNKPRLLIPSEKMRYLLWEHALKAGLEKAQYPDNTPFDAVLDTFFDVDVGIEHRVGDLTLSFAPTPHVQNMECYSVTVAQGDKPGVHWTSDTTQPVTESVIDQSTHVFHDVQLFEGGVDRVHIPYTHLRDAIPKEKRGNVYLIGYGPNPTRIAPKRSGFAGFVRPGQSFQF